MVEKDEHERAKVVELHFARFKRKTPFKLPLAVRSAIVGTLSDGTTDDAAVLCYDDQLVADQKQEGQDRAKASANEKFALAALCWYSRRGTWGDKGGLIELPDLSTAMARPELWSGANSNAARAVVDDTTTLDDAQRKDRDRIRKRLERWAKALSADKDKHRRAIVPDRKQTGDSFVFDAHAAARLVSGSGSADGEGGEE